MLQMTKPEDMKNLIPLLLITLLSACPQFITAQNEATDETDGVENLESHQERNIGIMARKLLTDFSGPLDKEPFDFQKWNGGFELGLRVPINHFFDVAIPFKASSITLPEIERNVNIFSVDLQGHLSPLSTSGYFHPYLVTGLGFVLMDGDDFSLALPAGLGTNIRINHRVDLNLELSYRIGLGSGLPGDSYQMAVGFIYNLSDRPVEKPKTLPELEAPATPKLLDSDGDGIPDIYDLAPGTTGKPEFLGGLDRDGDGIPDHLDKCPDQPGTAENKGCPDEEKETEVIAIDDRRVEADDEPAEEVIEEQEEEVSDIPLEVQEVLNVAMRAVQFDLGRATLRPESFGILNQIADIMSEYPQYNLRISGHTDNIGSASNNQRLSEQRARSCFEYLASRGVSTSRMSFVGYGESRPIDTNETPQGRANNRRVEFNLYLR
ncbi:MAG: hypothetical protein EA409_03635 [Saprospirales bacterium]|nr:MAG: hypothetical protein EA409_03635 [Saprospirales bacterium]